MLVRDDRSGLYYRAEYRDDKSIMAEARRTYMQLPVQAGDIVLDLGAHIGCSVERALALGAARVVAVEPDPLNFAVLLANVVGKPVTPLQLAVGDTDGWAELYRSEHAPCSHSLVTHGKKIPLNVPVIGFDRLLEQWRPAVVKCDIEHSEFIIPRLAERLSGVRGLAIEVHLGGRFREPGLELLASIEAAGFQAVKPYHVSPKAWSVNTLWVREKTWMR